VIGPALVDSKFLCYQFEASQLARYLTDNARGTAQKGVYLKTLAKAKVHLAPLREQRRIVAKIEELFSELDKGVEALTTAREQLKAFRQSVLFQTFLCGEKRTSNKLSTGWNWTRIDALAETITKGASPKWQGINYVADPTLTMFVTSENVRENYIDVSEPKYVEDKINEIQKRSVLKYGDLLFNIVGASIGRAAVYKESRKANINQAVAVIRLPATDMAEYISLFLNSFLGQSHYLGKRVEVARANLSLKDVGEIRVPMPPVCQLPRVLQGLGMVLADSDRLMVMVDEELVRIVSLRQSILKQAFSGQLVAQDPADEPASVLLERIRAERNKADAKKPGRKTKITGTRKTGKRATA
jgi:hypothetical protein